MCLKPPDNHQSSRSFAYILVLWFDSSRVHNLPRLRLNIYGPKLIPGDKEENGYYKGRSVRKLYVFTALKPAVLGDERAKDN